MTFFFLGEFGNVHNRVVLPCLAIDANPQCVSLVLYYLIRPSDSANLPDLSPPPQDPIKNLRKTFCNLISSLKAEFTRRNTKSDQKYRATCSRSKSNQLFRPTSLRDPIKTIVTKSLDSSYQQNGDALVSPRAGKLRQD